MKDIIKVFAGTIIGLAVWDNKDKVSSLYFKGKERAKEAWKGMKARMPKVTVTKPENQKAEEPVEN